MKGTAEVDIQDWNIPGNPVDILEEVHDDSIVLDQEEVGNKVEVVEDKDNQVQRGLDTLEEDMGRVVYSLQIKQYKKEKINIYPIATKENQSILH